VQWNAADGSLELTADDAQAWAQVSTDFAVVLHLHVTWYAVLVLSAKGYL